MRRLMNKKAFRARLRDRGNHVGLVRAPDSSGDDFSRNDCETRFERRFREPLGERTNENSHRLSVASKKCNR